MRSLFTLASLRCCAVLAACFVFGPKPAVAQAPAAWQWGLQTQNPTPADGTVASGNAVATDATGRLYVGGSFGEDLNGTPVATRSLPGAGTLGPGRGGFVAQATAAGQWAWVTAAVPLGAAAGGTARASVTSLVATAAGDVYATGYAEGTGLQVGGLTRQLGSTGRALFVARLNSAGVCQWLQTADGFAPVSSVALDPSTGGAVVAGTYRGAPSIGGTTLPPGTSPNGEAVFVARLSAAGQWLSAVGATGSGGVISGLNMAVGPAGQVAVSSSRSGGTLAFGAHSLSTPATFDETFVVAQLSPANQWQWAVGSSAVDYNRAIGVAYTAAGALWVAGRGEAGTVVGPLTLGAPGTPVAGTYSGFLGQLSPAGQWGTVRQLTPSGPGRAVFAALAVDAADNALATGVLAGTNGAVQAQLGSETLTATNQRLLFFVAGVSAAGQLRYVATVPPAVLRFGLTPAGIALDGGSGALYLTGTFTGGLALGASQLMGSYAPAGSTGGDVFVGKLGNATALAGRPGTAAPVLACYPNPARTATTLRLPAAAPEPRTATLADALGREVRRQSVSVHATATTLDLRGLTPGLYVVRCGAASGKLLVE